MKKVILSLMVGSVLFGGCARGTWVHPTKSESEQVKDRKICDYKAEIGTPRSGNAIGDGMRMGRLYRMCLDIKGYAYVKQKRN